jgi:CBS domain containing-hemolysin-like protein
MDIGLRLAAVLALVAANGFFVAAEFALVTARKTRIEQLAARGNRAAMAVRRAIDDPNRFISACQLGITVASLALGWIGESTIAAILEPWLSALLPHEASTISAHAIAAPIAFVVITFMHITLGEQAPKMIALQKGEETALVTVGPTNVIGFVFRPFISLLYSFTDFVLRPFGLRWQAEMHQAYTPEDVKLIVQSSRASGGLDGDSEHIVERALDFARLSARHVMVPRTEMVAVPADVTLLRIGEIMRTSEHSRYPVFEGSSDNVVGILSAKRLAAALATDDTDAIGSFDVRRHMSPPLFAPQALRADQLLAEMKKSRSHLAILVDEYGTTAGLVTLRDMLDRIAGEAPDESELAPPTVQHLPDGTAIVDGLALLPDVEAEFGIAFGSDDYDTLGGFIFGRLGRRPAVGDRVEAAGMFFTVQELDGLRVSRVRVTSVADASEASENGQRAVHS